VVFTTYTQTDNGQIAEQQSASSYHLILVLFCSLPAFICLPFRRSEHVPSVSDGNAMAYYEFIASFPFSIQNHDSDKKINSHSICFEKHSSPCIYV